MGENMSGMKFLAQREREKIHKTVNPTS